MFRIEYSVVNVDQLGLFDAGGEVTIEAMVAAGLVKSSQGPVKVLARGEIDRALKVKAHRFSPAAKAKIEAAGGTAEEVGHVATEVE
jgi:large subunit ribosomal protein L15